MLRLNLTIRKSPTMRPAIDKAKQGEFILHQEVKVLQQDEIYHHKKRKLGNFTFLLPLRYWQRVRHHPRACSVSFLQSRTVYLLDEAEDLNVTGGCAKRFSLFLSCFVLFGGLDDPTQSRSREQTRHVGFILCFITGGCLR